MCPFQAIEEHGLDSAMDWKNHFPSAAAAAHLLVAEGGFFRRHFACPTIPGRHTQRIVNGLPASTYKTIKQRLVTKYIKIYIPNLVHVSKSQNGVTWIKTTLKLPTHQQPPETCNFGSFHPCSVRVWTLQNSFQRFCKMWMMMFFLHLIPWLFDESGWINLLGCH